MPAAGSKFLEPCRLSRQRNARPPAAGTQTYMGGKTHARRPPPLFACRPPVWRDGVDDTSGFGEGDKGDKCHALVVRGSQELAPHHEGYWAIEHFTPKLGELQPPCAHDPISGWAPAQGRGDTVVGVGSGTGTILSAPGPLSLTARRGPGRRPGLQSWPGRSGRRRRRRGRDRGCRS